MLGSTAHHLASLLQSKGGKTKRPGKATRAKARGHKAN
jgi:hypothetical protein